MVQNDPLGIDQTSAQGHVAVAQSPLAPSTHYLPFNNELNKTVVFHPLKHHVRLGLVCIWSLNTSWFGDFIKKKHILSV